MQGKMLDGTWQMNGSGVLLQDTSSQPYLRSVPAAVWYRVWSFCWVVLVAFRPDHWSYLVPDAALVQLRPAVEPLSVLNVQVQCA